MFDLRPYQTVKPTWTYADSEISQQQGWDIGH